MLNKEDLLQAVIEHWENKNEPFFDGAHGLEYFRRLPEFMVQHTLEPGLIELFLTLRTEATNPQHPARKWAIEGYERTVNLGIGYLREAAEMGQVLAMDSTRLELEARGVFALMDGLQLQWLLDPSLDAAGIFKTQLSAIIERWSGAAAGHRGLRMASAQAQTTAGQKGPKAC